MISKKRIFIFLDYYLPGTKAGGPVQTIQSLIKLTENQLRYSILTSSIDSREPEVYRNITPKKWEEIEGTPIFYVDGVRSLLNQLNIISRDNNIVYINSFFSLQFSIIPIVYLALKRYRGRVIVAPRGELTKGAMSISSFKKNLYLLSFKTFINRKNIEFHCTSVDEKESTQKLIGEKNQFHLIYNPINFDYLKGYQSKFKRIHKKKKSIRLIYVSRITPKKNLHLILDILSKINEIAVTFTIIGNIDDDAYWTLCKSKIDKLRSNVNIICLGHLEKTELLEKLIQSDLFLLPTKNENFGHAIVEAMFMGCPILISDQTPWTYINEFGGGAALSLSQLDEWLSFLTDFSGLEEIKWQEKSRKVLRFINQSLDKEKIKNQYIELFSN